MFFISMTMYIVALICVFKMLWYGYKGEEKRSDRYGIIGVLITLGTTAAILLNSGGY